MVDLIGRMPECGTRISRTNPPEFVIKSAEPIGPGLPVVTFHYRMNRDDESITLLRVRYHDA